MRAPAWLLAWADKRIDELKRREPDFIIAPLGKPFLNRWHLFRNKRLGTIYLHQTVDHDDQRALHDHPWSNISVIVRGAYFEIVPADGTRPYHGGDAVTPIRRERGDVIFRKALTPHSLLLPGGNQPEECWSLFITGPVVRRWGFYCPNGWVDESVYRVRKGKTSEVGQGCG